MPAQVLVRLYRVTPAQMRTKIAPTMTPVWKLGSRPLPAAYLSPYAWSLDILVDRPLLSFLSLTATIQWEKILLAGWPLDSGSLRRSLFGSRILCLPIGAEAPNGVRVQLRHRSPAAPTLGNSRLGVADARPSHRPWTRVAVPGRPTMRRPGMTVILTGARVWHALTYRT